MKNLFAALALVALFIDVSAAPAPAQETLPVAAPTPPAPAVGAASSAAAPAAKAPNWRQPEAEFRLSAVPANPGEASGLDLRRLVLPAPLSNGVQVFDDAGKPIPFRLNGDFSLAIAPAPQAKRLDVYFGYSAKQPFSTWKAPSKTRPATPAKLENRKGVDYPLLSRKSHYLLYTGKQSTVPLESFDFLTPADELEWRIGSSDWRLLDELPVAVIPGDAPETALAFRRIGHPETELTVLNSDYRTGHCELHPDLRLKIWAPEIIYDDEELLITVETVSRLPLEIEAQLDIAIDGKPSELRRIRLPAKPDERTNRSAADICRKDAITLSGQQTKEIGTIEVKLAIENFEFDHKTIHILPIAAENLTSQLNADDDVILVLQRPKLSDIRNWELPRKIGDELTPCRKLLLIGEAVNGFASLAREQLKTGKKQIIEFVPFADSETPLCDRLPELLDRLGESDADLAVLFLPCLFHTGTLETWRRDRYIAALLEKLRGNRNVHAIFLVPAPQHPGEERREQLELQEALRRLAREYDVQLFKPVPAPPPTGVEYPFHTQEEFLPLLKSLREKL